MADPIDREWVLFELRDRYNSARDWYIECNEGMKLRADQAIATFIECILTVKNAPSIQLDGKKCEKCYWHIFAMGEIPNESSVFRPQCDGCPHTNTLKTATWIPRKGGAVCSCCRHIEGQYKYKQYRYCPWCGAKIIKEEP